MKRTPVWVAMWGVGWLTMSRPSSGFGGPPRGARSATLAGGTAARSGEAASTARGGTLGTPPGSAANDPCTGSGYACYLSLGTAELRLGKFVAAAEHLAHSLTLFPVNGSPDANAKTEALLEEAKKEVGTLRLAITPAAALVKVGDRQLTAEDRRDQVFVEPGEMRVSAGGVDDYEGASQSVKVAKGQVVDVTLTLKKSVQIMPTASGTPSAVPSATPVDPIRTPLLVTGTIVGVAAVAAGIGLLVGSSAKLDEGKRQRDELLQDPTAWAACNKPQPEPRCKLGALDEASTFGNVGVPLLVGGVAVGAATLIYALVARPKAPPPIQAGATVSSKGGGLFVSGNW